ncbi:MULTISPECIES: hypothetical protein [unclassified Sphingomonas]|uniref:hypothetical protein n=1 Tax=unclassified Sphingomonas TaxID=196159 RepID=UPI00044D5317|nr:MULTISPECIES: hypothetical protein [unclassified Sphingomonas]EZP53815.1 hypothetical protein BW41_01751 [Sphingomonas sp. RIT328]
MSEIERLVPSGVIDQWVSHLRRQRSRAQDALWLLDQGFTIHDGRDGIATADASDRWRREQAAVVDDVNRLLELYDRINLRSSEFVAAERTTGRRATDPKKAKE